MMYPMGFGFSGEMILVFLFQILIWILVIIGIFYLIKYIIIQNQGKKQEKTPLDILKERYARGEINKDEFEQKKKDLTE